MPKYRDGWNDPPPTATPLDHEPTHYTRRYAKRGLVAFAVAGLTGLTYALLPLAFAVGGGLVGIWWVGAKIYGWLERNTDEESLRS